MKRRVNILAGLMVWYSRVIFLGLVMYGFMLYAQNEWMMIR